MHDQQVTYYVFALCNMLEKHSYRDVEKIRPMRAIGAGREVSMAMKASGRVLGGDKQFCFSMT